MHYLYPENVNDELLDYIAKNPKICKYVDIPLQHIDENILISMNRRVFEEQSRELIFKLKTKYPQIAIRSTFIVGYPGEKKKQFNKLVEFIKEAKLNNVGFFPYYREEKTKAYFLKKQNSNYTKLMRLRKIQKIQTEVANELNKNRIGETVRVLIDRFDETTGYYVCHDEFNSFSVDFEILLDGNSNVEFGKFYNINIVDYKNGYLIGEIQ